MLENIYNIHIPFFIYNTLALGKRKELENNYVNKVINFHVCYTVEFLTFRIQNDHSIFDFYSSLGNYY